jgi:hypothetical protein
MSVTYLGSKKLQISETQTSEVNFIGIAPELITKEYVSHHILLADVSGSMSGNNSSMKKRLILTLQELLKIPNSYVSIIKYSGHNESSAIVSAVKCDELSYKMSKVYDVIENELRIESVTVISEPLEKCIQMCKDLAQVVDKNHIALFTDGCLVPTKWNESKEREKCFAVAEICKKENIFLNAIGFSQYYDRRFLKELIDIAGNGQVLHIDSISNYSDCILNLIKKVNAVDMITTHIKTTDEQSRLFVLSNSLMTNDNVDAVLTGRSNVVAIIDSEHYNVDGVSRQFGIRGNASDGLVDDFYYSLARYYLQEEDTDNYEFIIMALGDIHLFNVTQNCYSFIEKGNAVNTVTEAFENRNKRFLAGRNPITYSIENEPLCLLEILQDIMTNPESMLYWDIQTPYHKIGVSTNNIEDNITFERQKTGLLPVSSLVIGSEKLNIGIGVNIPGVVTDSISGLTRDASVFRSYNLVNGGNINVPFINCKLSPQQFDRLVADGVDLEINKDFTFAGGVNIYKLNLNGIKSANKRLLKSMTISELLENLKTISDLKAKQWTINKLIKEVLGDQDKVEMMSNLSVDEIDIRKIMRIDHKGIYKPLSVEKDTDSPYEIYSAVHLTYEVKFDEKKAQAAHMSNIKTQLGIYKVGDQKVYATLSKMLDDLKADMKARELRVNMVRISSAIIGKNPAIIETAFEKEKTTTDKILQRNMVVGGKIRVFQKVFEDTQDILTIKRWTELIKCN